MRRSFLVWVLATVLDLVLTQPACTDTDVFESPGLGKGQQDNKMTVKGDFCTEHPDEMSYPVKIMFIIDCSQSHNVTDPRPAPDKWSGRVQAVWDVISKFRYDPGVSFAIVRFDSTANVETQVDTDGDGRTDQYGFTNDLAALLRATNALQPASGNTSYDAALALAQSTLQMDINISSIYDPGRTKYVVIFLSDGIPYPVNPITHVNTEDSIKLGVKGIMNLAKNNIAGITFHTAFLSSSLEPANVIQQAQDLLKTMLSTAEQVLADMGKPGGGTFRNFRNGEEINFLNIDYTSVKRTYTIKDNSFLAYNLNASPVWDPKSDGVDTDGDGLVDSVEREIGTAVGARDTDGDGFSDFLEYRLRQSGFDPLNPNDAPCAEKEGRLDRDGDGLLDCEELFFGTNPELFDTDGDGIPDQIEVRTGTNPVWKDTDMDMDFDGTSNGKEVAWHTNPTLNDAADFSKWAYRYQLSRIPGIFEGRMCYNFQVENITLMPTEVRVSSTRQGYNDIMVYVGQSPSDDPTADGLFRVACARTRYIPRSPQPDIKLPPSGVVTFEQKDFKRPVATVCNTDAECPYQVCEPSSHLCLDQLGAMCNTQTACPNFACVIKPSATQGTCAYPVQTTCLTNDDCPFYPTDPATGQCMDAAHSLPGAVNKQCPRRECIPPYSPCGPTTACLKNTDVPPNPYKDLECLAGSCRMPCQNPNDCYPGDTCESDSVKDWTPCTPATAATDCPSGFVCQDQRCRQSCTMAAECTSSWTESCNNGLCVGHHCVDRHGGSCQGVVCTDDTQCPPQVCDTEMGRCRTQPCLDSRECSHQHCEPVLGFCTGPTCAGNNDCRGERGYTCSSVVGALCSRDIDCPVNFCSLQVHNCYHRINNQKTPCTTNANCPLNDCVSIGDLQFPDAGICRYTRSSCAISNNGGDCLPNICLASYVCINDPSKDCDPSKEGIQAFNCPRTYCGTDNRCINDSTRTCNPATENNDNNCRAGTCSRANSLGACDTAVGEACQNDQDCPFYRCNASVGLCDYPVEVACTSTDTTPCQKLGSGFECSIPSGTVGFCIKRCGSDGDCPHTRCQGRCVPAKAEEQKRCTDWFNPDRDCLTFEEP